MEVIDFGFHEDMGYWYNEFPLKHGNGHTLRTEIVPYDNSLRTCLDKYRGMPAMCFFIYEQTIEDYNVDNICFENFYELFKRKILSWPVECELIGDRRIKITDTRIPEDWLR